MVAAGQGVTGPLGKTLFPAVLGLAVAASACGGGGGGGDGPKIKVGFQADSSTVDEGSTASVLVELTTPADLAEDVTVELGAAELGGALSGTDFEAIPTQTLTFVAGSSSGSTLAVDVTALADTLVEDAAEGVRLVLASPSPGAGLTKISSHAATLGDQNPVSVQFELPSTTTLDESDAVFDLNVELELDPGDTLAVDVEVTVRDSSSGTASSGSDYAAFAPTTLTFPAGSGDGSMDTVQVTVQNDVVVEPSETIVLALDPPVSAAGAGLGTNNEHVVTITEDDLSGTPFLHLGESGGPDVDHGDTLALGSAPLDGGPTAGVTLELTNLGTDPMSTSQLNLTGDVEDFALEFLEDGPSGLPAEMPAAEPFPLEPTGEDPLEGVYLRFHPGRAANLLNRENVRLVGVPLPGGVDCELELQRVPLPWAPDAVYRVDGVERLVHEDLDGLTLWRGTVVGDEGSRVFLAFSRAGSFGWLRCDNGRSFELVSERARGNRPTNARLVSSDLLELQLPHNGFQCLEAPVPGGTPPGAGLLPQPEPEGLVVGLSTADCRLAIETDFQLTEKLGTAAATTTYVTQLVAAVSAQYLEDVQTSLSIAYLGVYSSAADPWTTPDGAGDTSDMLDEFQDAWNLSGWPASADLAHFLSGANLGGGIAYVNVLCDNFWGYGVSANIGGNIDWGTWTGDPTGNSWDFVVLAHELGHNFGASHTHNYCPPIDRCYANCDGVTNCVQGTIMSYCHLCGGMGNLRLEFHPFIANVMRSSVGSSCLGGTTIDGGATATFQVRFEPTSSTGAKAATLSFTHDAPNVSSPFQLDLTGTAQ